MKRFVWMVVGLLALALAGLWGLCRLAGIDAAQLAPEHLGERVRAFGVWAPAVYLAAYSQPLLPLPASLMTVVGGIAFGNWWGLLASVAGATLRACLEFLIARRVGRAAVSKWLKGNLAALDQKIAEHGFKSVLLIRLIPNVPFDMQNYGLGCSRVGFGPYVLATILGLLPGSLACIYLGYSLANPKQLWMLGLAAAMIAMLMLARQRGKARRLRASAPAPEESVLLLEGSPGRAPVSV